MRLTVPGSLVLLVLLLQIKNRNANSQMTDEKLLLFLLVL